MQESGEYQRISDIIPARGDIVGAYYEHIDPDVEVGETYYYRLEALEVTGAYELHGPISATLPPLMGLELSKGAVSASARVGDALTYTLRITNTGQLALHAVVTDVLSQYITTTHPLTWTPAITSPGGTWSQEFVVTVTTGCPGPITTVLRVTTDEGVSGVYTTVTGFVNQPPVAEAGAGQAVAEGSLVLLDGRNRTDIDGHLPLTFWWWQTGGDTVHIIGADEPLAAFQAPSHWSVLTFTLTVTDALGLGSRPGATVVSVGADDFPVWFPLVGRGY